MPRRRRILLVLAVVGSALALLVACAPLLAGTATVRRFVAGRIAKALGRPVELKGLDAGWASGVSLEGLVVRSGAAEFRDAPLLEAASVRLESGLLGLVFKGVERVAVDKLVVRLEEQAGGRTNIDDLVKAFTKPPPAPPPKPKPFRLRLTDASIHVRRLIRRPQPRPVDPFREDPVILDADEGLLVTGVDDLDLLLATTPAETTLDLTATVRTGDSTGRAEASVRLGAKGPSGKIVLEGIDLSLLRPFVAGLEGRVTLRVEGSPEGADVSLRAEDLKVLRFDEAWVTLSGRVRKDGEGVALDDLSLRTASDAFALDGRGAWPPKGLEIKARAATEALGLRMKGPLLLDARGEGPDFTGTLMTPDGSARFDVALLEDGVLVRALDAKAFESTVSLAGEVGKAVRLSGRADVRLADLGPLLPEGATVAGRLRVERFALEDLSLKADAEVTGLFARGLFAEEVRIDRGELHVDAELSEDRDVLRVARAQLDGLAAQGTVSGLSTKEIRADGTVKGTLALNPLHARLLGLEEVRGLRGQLTVDVRAATGAEGIDASGTATVDGFHVGSDAGAWDVARISAEGSYRAGAAKGTVTMEKLRVEHGREAWDLARMTAGGSYAGGDADVQAGAEGLVLRGSLRGGKGTVELDVDAIERQPLLMRALDLPPDVALEGPVRVRADVGREPWNLQGTVDSSALTAKLDGRGIDKERLRLSFTARETERGWLVALPSLALAGLGVEASLLDCFLGRDGSIGGRLHLEGPAQSLAAFAPGTAAYEPQGRIVLDAKVSYDGRWTATGGVEAREASLLLAGSRAPPKTARIEFDAVREEGAVLLRRVRLTTKTTELLGAGSIGSTLTLRMEGRTRLEEISPYAPVFKGSGEVTLDEIALDLAADGRVSASASLHAAALRIEGGRLAKATVRSRVEGRLAKGAFEDVKTDLSVSAARAERGNILVEDLVLREKGGGRSGAYALDTRVDCARVRVGATSWERVGLDVRGRLDTLLGERPPTGVGGEITFAKWNLGPFLWEATKGRILVQDGRVLVRDLAGTLHGGTVVAQGTLVPDGERLRWEASASAKGLVLTEQIGKPISFIVPFLRVKKEAGQLKGRADFDLRLAAEDTTDAAILRTLSGAGIAHLYEIEVKNSILLPLLSLRLDKAILREPYRFKDLRVAFDVGGGKIRPQPFELKATPFGVEVKEIEVGLDGSVDALILPGIIPLRVHGTLDDPKVRPAPFAPFR